jgi:molybdopterin synthase sulfur carrier subunit
MKVKVLYFAAVRDLVGRDEEDVVLPDEVTTAVEFSRWLESFLPALAGRMSSVRIARNEVFALGDERLADGDILALIPPVAGG